MPNTDFATPEAMQKASDLLEKLLQQQDYFNSEKMDEIQTLAIRQTGFFEVEVWQGLLRNQKDIALYFTNYLNFYLQNYKQISDLYTQEIRNEAKIRKQLFWKNLQLFDLSTPILNRTEFVGESLSKLGHLT